MSVMVPLMRRAYGSTRSLCGLHRMPVLGSYGPWTRKPYFWPGVTPGTSPCQTPNVRSVSSIRRSLPSSSIRHSSTRSATLLATANRTPPASGWAPSGNGRPASTWVSAVGCVAMGEYFR